MDYADDSRPMKSAFDSPTFGEDTSFKIDQPVGSMSISPCGRDVILGSKEGLYVIDLDSPYSPPRYLAHHTPWEVADVQWSPFAARDSWVISTSNQKALVWNLSMPSWEDSIEYVLHAHTRAITDINFSAHHPDVLATCAVDSFVHCWDLRTPSRPSISFSDWFAGATQVKWNRQDAHIIGSSHDKYLRIWDERMGAHPLRTIQAHSTKIYGIDWNRLHRNAIVTCSLDKKISFWDFEDSADIPERTINTGFPIWRARHTPFGWGVLAMPQRGNYDLHLYDRRGGSDDACHLQKPAARFSGHKAQVKEFLWRPRGTITDSVDERDFQLVTWGVDRELRLHRVLPETMEAIGYVKGVSKVPQLNFTRRGAIYKTFRDEPEPQIRPDSIISGQIEGSSSSSTSYARQQRTIGVGMSKVEIPLTRGWPQSANSGSHVGMHGRSSIRQDMNPIAWMKNVKISSWESETLGDEITQVGEKFTKVLFESVDVNQRKTTISLQGPWAEDHSSLFLKLDIKFPRAYPQNASPQFNLQKTASMTNDMLGILKLDLDKIAETYMKQKRGCLEAVVRYLLREQDVQEIVEWASEEPIESSEILAAQELEADVSSDEDDEAVGGFPAQVDLNSSEILNANVLVPVAKACGALWAEDGRLVCFFPPKSAQPASFLDFEGTRNRRIFEGFGRLQTSSPGPKAAAATTTTADEDTSDLSDTSSTSSGSSSGSSDVLASLPTGFLPPNAWRAGGFSLQRSRSADQSQRSTNGLGTVNSSNTVPPNVISIHHLEHLLPTQRDIAEEYWIVGEDSNICEHNAKVAERYGRFDASTCWEFLGFILEKRVPLEKTRSLDNTDDVIVRAHRQLHHLNRQNTGLKLESTSLQSSSRPSKLETCGFVHWDLNTFTSKKLISDFISHFEALGDIQMLATLSCILFKPKPSQKIAKDANLASMRLSAPGYLYYPSSLVAHSLLRLDTDSSPEIVDRKECSAAAIAITKTDSVASSGERYATSSAEHSNTPGTSPSIPQFHDGRSDRDLAVDFPDRVSNRRSLEIRDRERVMKTPYHTSSLSSSPKDNRFGRRANSNLGFSLSRASLTNLVQSYSGSPPNNSHPTMSSRKHPSPEQSITSGAASSSYGDAADDPYKVAIRSSHSHSAYSDSLGVDAKDQLSRSFPNARETGSWLTSPNISPPKASSKTSTVRSSRSSVHSISSPGRSGKKRRIITKMTLRNQDIVSKADGAGVAFVPLLDPSLEPRFRAYREQYAGLLDVWRLYEQRKEMLMFNASKLHQHFNTVRSVSGGADDTSERKGHKPSTDSAATQVPGHAVTENDALASLHQRRASAKPHSQGLPKVDLKPEKIKLNLQKHCVQCGELLSAVLKNGVAIKWYCVNCSDRPVGKINTTVAVCAICQEQIYGLLIPCLNCGHASCFECAMQWFGTNTTSTRKTTNFYTPILPSNQECPAACGCFCPRHGCVEAPYPQAPSSPLQYSFSNPPQRQDSSISSQALNYPPSLAPSHRPSMARTKSSTGGGSFENKGHTGTARYRSHTTRSTASAGEEALEDPDEEEEDGVYLGAGFGGSAGRRVRGMNI
ncbi:MAG: hypothetical protein Q9227_008648 [Pyrenula ochraceoflavens]